MAIFLLSKDSVLWSPFADNEVYLPFFTVASTPLYDQKRDKSIQTTLLPTGFDIVAAKPLKYPYSVEDV